MNAFLYAALFLCLCVLYAHASPPLPLPYDDQWVWVRTERKDPEEKPIDPVEYEDMFFRGAPTMIHPRNFYRPCYRCPLCCRDVQV
uniref:Uncharacterized protein n=1 Tax=Steinernema glaseri TaxID=37863 RepID=A0A1I7Z1V2_9BILA